MAEKKFYAVRKGKKPGIYSTWDKCKKQVDGFSGAEYKGFGTLIEAETFYIIQKSKRSLSELTKMKTMRLLSMLMAATMILQKKFLMVWSLYITEKRDIFLERSKKRI